MCVAQGSFSVGRPALAPNICQLKSIGSSNLTQEFDCMLSVSVFGVPLQYTADTRSQLSQHTDIAAHCLRCARTAMNAVDTVRVNARNQKLHVRTFPPAGQPKAVLVWHHGTAVRATLFACMLLCLPGVGTVSRL